jgi:hypothetical protein
MNQTSKQPWNIWLVLFVLSVILAFKDFGFKLLLLQNISIYQILLFTGVFFLVLMFIAALHPLTAQAMKPRPPRSPMLQLTRIALSGVSFLSMIKALSLMSATTFGISSKIFVPVMILSATALGQAKYHSTQRVLAALSICALVLFSIVGRDSIDNPLGFVFVGISIASVILEYSLLRKSALEDSHFWTTLPPAISFLTIGLLGCLISSALPGFSKIFTLGNLGILAIASSCLFLIFSLSKIKYQALPLGFSEYPSLISVFVILALESAFLDWRPNFIYLGSLAFVSLLMGLALSWDHLAKSFLGQNSASLKKEVL